jgi:multidrug transporter EmrE-like cation transporter
VKTPISSILLVLTASFIGSFGAVFLKSGAGRLRLHWHALVFNWRLIAGAVAYIISSIFFVAGLRNGELTILYPMVALGYIWTLIWSRLFFGEPLTRYKFLGIALIIAGIFCLTLGNR